MPPRKKYQTEEERKAAELASAATRQARHRERTKLLRTPIRELIDEFTAACDRGRCWSIVRGLPEEDTAAILELAARLRERRLIVCKLEE